MSARRKSLAAAPAATAFGYAGAMVAGLGATLWQLWSRRTRGWCALAVLLVAALAVTAIQLRGAYAGALLAAPALAAMVGAARVHGALRLAGAWAASAGMLYPLAAEALTPGAAAPAPSGGDCASPELAKRLATLPAGTVMAPIDAGAWLIAATPQRLVAAPYHRDNPGNLAAYRFFLGPSGDAGRSIVDAWNVRYVLACDGDLSAMGAGAATMARRLATGHPPHWLTPLPAPAGAHLYAVRR